MEGTHYLLFKVLGSPAAEAFADAISGGAFVPNEPSSRQLFRIHYQQVIRTSEAEWK